MKSILLNKIIALLLVFLLFCSCNKFLSVNPKTQLPQAELFSTETGFKDALTGVYIQMKDPAVYGQAMSMTTIEYLVSSWDVTANSVQQKLGLFNYADADVQNSLSAIFSKEYSVIANINSILSQIDAKKSVFTTPGMYELIKSECLGLRAYCHLDLLRLFGPIPSDPANGNQLAYVTTLSNLINQHISFQDYETALVKDLTDAEALAKGVDPIMQYSLQNLRVFGAQYPGNSFNPSDDYVAYRYLRMNYYAIKATEARAYLWFGQNDKAYSCAKEVIDAQNPDGSVKFRLGTATDFANGDYLLSSEQIFGLYAFDMYDTYTNLFSSGTLKKSSSATLVNTKLYGNTGTDIRETSLWNVITLTNSVKCYVIKKYQVVQTPPTLLQDYKQIPMLRISEMYLTAIETGPVGDAQTLWNTYRTARNLPSTTLPSDPVQLQNTLLQEYRKEFFAEGQAFFAYKRLNAPKASIIFIPTAAVVNYLVPLPTSESVNLN